MGFANMYLQAYYLYCYVLLTERFLEYPIPNYEFSKQSCLFSSKESGYQIHQNSEFRIGNSWNHVMVSNPTCDKRYDSYPAKQYDVLICSVQVGAEFLYHPRDCLIQFWQSYVLVVEVGQLSTR